jgi:HEAT repeat protein
MRYSRFFLVALTLSWYTPFSLVWAQTGTQPSEKVVAHGKSLRYWIDCLKDPEVLVREEGILVLADLGPAAKDAIPELTKLLKDEHLAVRFKSATALAKIDRQLGKTVVPMLCEGAKQGGALDRAQAVQLLGQMGADAKDGCETLLESLNDPDANVRHFASQALNQIGEAAIPTVQAALAHKDVTLRRQAAETLGRMGARAKPAAPALTELLKDDDRLTRVKAAQALWWIDQRVAVVIPVLAESMQDKDVTVRRAANTALYQIQPRPKEALPAFLAALKDEDALMRVQSAQAVWEIDHKADEVMPALLDVLKHSKDQMIAMNQALLVLGLMGAEAKEAVPALIEILQTPNTPFMYQVSNALGQIGASAVGPLGEVLANKETPVTLLYPIIQALAQIGPEGAEPLLKALEHENQVVRQNAIQALGRMGPGAKPAVPKLIEFLSGNDAGLRNSALWALNQLGLDGRAAIPALVENLKSPEQYVVIQSIQALRNMNPDSKVIVPALSDCLKSTNPTIRAYAADLIAAVDRENAAVMPVLIELLKQRNSEALALAALGHMGRAAKEAVPELVQLLRVPPQQVNRLTILQTISQIGPAATEAAPALLDLLKSDRDPNNRNYALAALKNIRGDAKEVVPAMLALLNETNANMNEKHYAIDVLAAHGTEAKEAIPALQEMLKRPDLTRARAADALVQIAPDRAKELVYPAMEPWLSQQAFFSTPAAQVVLKFDKDNQKAIDALVQGLKDSGDYNRQNAADALAKTGANGKKAIPALKEALKDGAPNVRTRAALALWKIDNQSAEIVLPLLLDELKTKEPPHMRLVAIHAVAELGSDAKKVIPELLELRKHRDLGVRNAATEAIKKIDPDAYAKIGMPEK